MSRRNQIKETWTAFGQNVQTEERGDCLNDMKTEILRVRMTPEEKAALNKQASLHHKTMSEYIRSVAKCPPDVTRDEFESSICLLYTSPSPRDGLLSRMPSSA